MEEGIKSRIILILSILCLILLISSISSCSNAFRQKTACDKEMFSRLDLEEKMGKFGQEKAALLKQIEEEKASVEAMKKDLVQEQSVNQVLKEELDKMTRLKETLEENLKEALVKKKK